jgi:hypothetical protein
VADVIDMSKAPERHHLASQMKVEHIEQRFGKQIVHGAVQ